MLVKKSVRQFYEQFQSITSRSLVLAAGQTHAKVADPFAVSFLKLNRALLPL
jgi:hypothetical protein